MFATILAITAIINSAIIIVSKDYFCYPDLRLSLQDNANIRFPMKKEKRKQ